MKYLVVQIWSSTKGNHAGIYHMCHLLKQDYPNDYKIIKRAPPFYQKKGGNAFVNFFNKLVFYYKARFLYNYLFKLRCYLMISRLQKGDEVFLLEYLHPKVSQYNIAKKIRERSLDVKIYGMAHLTPNELDCLFAEQPLSIFEWASLTDKILTLGSSLRFYLTNCGIDKNRISVGFHYVDLNYYSTIRHPLTKRKKIIAMGNMRRNYSLLGEIVKRFSDVDWILCAGMQKETLSELVENANNIKIEGFVSESRLRSLMCEADISLNVMDDTIGSNVIVTSMAMGLAMVVSNVGSIHDYCDESNAVFCENNVESFVEKLHKLINNDEKIVQMQNNSVSMSKRLTIQNVNSWFSSLCNA